MRYTRPSEGFSAVELLITLFVAAMFLITGYQLYGIIIKSGTQTNSQAHAYNIAYDYLQRSKANAENPCQEISPSTPLVNDNSQPGLSNVTVTVTISCPYGTSSSISKVLVELSYGSGTDQKMVNTATYVGDSSN